MVMNIPLVVVLFIATSNAYPQGAPTKVCDTMVPIHGGGSIQPQTISSPYGVVTKRQANSVFVQIISPLGVPVEGFMLQGRTPNGKIIGKFEPSADSPIHTIDCGGDVANTLTHNNSDKKRAIEVKWNPPSDYEGTVIFNATIAQTYSNFWVGVESPQLQIDKRSINDPVVVTLPTQQQQPQPPLPSLSTTTPPNFTPQKERESATDFDPFYSGCSVTKLCFGTPIGCIQNENCKAVVAVTVSGDKYDFELKATQNAGWVGVGLSDDEKMGDDSVIECVKRGNSVAAYMSWTSGVPNYDSKRLSNPQLGIQLLNGSLIDDSIYCRVRRDAKTTVKGRVFDLVNDRYNLLVAAGKNVEPSRVTFHDISFLASGEQQSLSDVSQLMAASKLLLRLHGSFMLAAWIGTASIGILLARYYRKTWVSSSLCGKDLWFAWHRILMIATWALTIVGFILIWVELRAWSGENNPHAITGTVCTILCFLQPIGAYFRPHPGTPKRSIFNWVHWLMGNAAFIIAILTIFFAVKLTKAELPEFFNWILVAFVAVHVLIHLSLSIMDCVSEKTSERRITSFPMKELGGSGRNSSYTDRGANAPYAGFRKWLLAIYIIIVICLVVAFIVITALAPIAESWRNLRNSMMNAK